MVSAEKLLAGKRIVVTRAPEQAQDLVRALERLGAEVILLPMVAFAPPQDSGPLDRALRGLSGFDWVLFTSQNAVRFFSRRMSELGLERNPPHSAAPRMAAVGSATAAAVAKEGFHVDYVARNTTGESLARELRSSLVGRKALLPRSDRADARLPAALRESGADVSEVIAYRTAAPEALDPAIVARIRGGEVDVIAFASPSAFHNLSAAMGSNSELVALSTHVRFAAIGSSTARAMREAGVAVEIEASEASAAGLARAVAKYYESRAATTTARRP
ncbi:MAG TPA: uroporphyrinogen-III synthase [Candidatus Polarisedimenticolia bacterium]|nr:uroporphyrinogen-III synthase [Candidatus Polarisedimenticolia bacterium]